MNTKDIKQTLYQELERKKQFQARWDTYCDECGSNIQEDDDFYFFGDKRKICQECYNEIMNYLEEND